MPCIWMAVSALIMGVGYALCPETMQGGTILTRANRIGVLLVRCGGAVYDNIGLVFACFAAYAFGEEKKDAMAYGLVSYLMVSALLSPACLDAVIPSLCRQEIITEAFGFLSGPVLGIPAGIAGALALRVLARRGCDSVRMGIPACAGLSLLLAVLLGVIWPVAYLLVKQMMIASLGHGPLTAGVFVFLNRMFTPFGLNHAVNSVVLSDRAYIGDLVRYWAEETGPELGMYMGGFFAPMMFGIPGLLYAVYRDRMRRGLKDQRPYLLLFAIVSFIVGASEPLEFLILCQEPVFFMLLCLFYGMFALISALLGFRAGFAFSGGLCDLIFSSAKAASAKTWLILPVGAGAFLVFYLLTARILCNRKKASDETK